MNALFKFIFGTTSALLATATVFILTLFIGHAVTGSWKMQEWNRADIQTPNIVREYQPEQNTVPFDDYKLDI